jgi:hypothetical protein
VLVVLVAVLITSMAMEVVAVVELIKPQLHQMMLLFLHSVLAVQAAAVVVA